MLRPLGLAGMPVRSATVPRRSTCGGAYGGAYGGAPAPEGPLRPEEAESGEAESEEAESEEAEEPSPRAALFPEASAGDEDERGEVEEDMGVFIG